MALRVKKTTNPMVRPLSEYSENSVLPNSKS